MKLYHFVATISASTTDLSYRICFRWYNSGAGPYPCRRPAVGAWNGDASGCGSSRSLDVFHRGRSRDGRSRG